MLAPKKVMTKAQPKDWYSKKSKPNDRDIEERINVLMRSKDSFWAFLPQFSRGKKYKCKEVELPLGDYEELNVTDRREDSRSCPEDCVASCTDTCTSLGYECGAQVVCGVNTNCGSCNTGYDCISGTCVLSQTNQTDQNNTNQTG